MERYIKLYKKLTQWQWYKDGNTLRLFIDLLLEANFEDSKVGYQIIKRGQCLTSIKRIHENTGLTIKQIRTSLDKLEKSGEIGKQTTNKYSIITINKYNDYQEMGKQRTNKRQTKGNIKEYKEEEYKESISKDIPKKNFIKPTIEEIADYCKQRNNNIEPERFYDFYESKNWMVGKNKMKDWRACIRTWEQRNPKPKQELPRWFDKSYKKDETKLEELNKILEEF